MICQADFGLSKWTITFPVYKGYRKKTANKKQASYWSACFYVESYGATSIIEIKQMELCQLC